MTEDERPKKRFGFLAWVEGEVKHYTLDTKWSTYDELCNLLYLCKKIQRIIEKQLDSFEKKMMVEGGADGGG